MRRIGVIALQGDVSEHISAVEAAGGQAVAVRRAGVIPTCSGIVMPGGESTTIGRQLERTGIAAEIKQAAANDVPVLATCAGLVLAAKEIDAGDVRPLGLIDISVGRNAFGPQRESFEAEIDVAGFDRPYRAVFIRAPVVLRCGEGVQEIARFGGRTVAVRQRNLIGLAFHPELTEDLRFHRMLLEMG
ncbi:MAG: pyridoxal 5'-phosphate synthase glutaminase subunit PdxT [Methanothrix sp.]|uniref:pyridoxal 5'-phosphate synthase glutaminase subunit PdxT n=1 Tax=Methanothrix sp. TaxID=90426 RepID=UPI0026009BF9|nr:pyridoxal 5'-phosphate synthase glutaminase subunit PdxT [Methanothrix sp.]MCQ8902818.1 pyridoxal 5'-phosphate synthase glutaminase subunit PdxT [Methanothrix sp.]